MIYFNRHIGVLIAVSSAFICLLVYTSIRSTRFHQSFRRNIKHLIDDARQASAKEPPKWEGIPHWLEPFVRVFRSSFHVAHARDTAGKQLEETLAANREYLKLQKLQTAAPLIGVLLTATGFIAMEADFDDIQSLAIPLVGGVATGALLALFSQLAVYFAEIDIDESRKEGQLLIDEIWIKATSDIIDPHRSVLFAVGSLEAATSSLTAAMGSFPESVPALTQKFTELYELSNSTFAALAELTPQLKATSSDWRTASLTLKESTENELIPSHRLLLDGVKQLNSVCADFSAIAANLQDVCGSINNSCAEQQSLQASLISSARDQSELSSKNWLKQAQDFQEMQKLLLENTLVKTEQMLNQLSQSVTDHLSAIQAGTDEIKGPLNETAAFITASVPGLRSSSEILSIVTKAAQDFSETFSNTVLPSYQNLILFESLAHDMQSSIGRLNESLNELLLASKAGQDFSEVIRRRALPTVEVLQRATGAFEDSVNILAECTRELSNVLDKLTWSGTREDSVSVSQPNE